MGILGSLVQWFARLSTGLQLLIGLLIAVVGLGFLLLLLNLLGVLNLFGPAASPQPTATPGLSPTVVPATTAPATTAPVATTPGQATATIPPDDARLAPPEDFTLIGTADGMHIVSWSWPSGQSLDPTFFRVSVSGQPFDFDFTGPGEYEEEVPALCLNNPNFITLDAFNTDVEPEANSQAENLIEADPGC